MDKELPDSPGVWDRKDMCGDYTLVYRHDSGELAFVSITASGTWMRGGYLDELPRDRWFKLTPARVEELEPFPV